MTTVINVLVFPCGAENAMEVHTALKDVVNINLYGATGKEDHGAFVFKQYIGGLPYINDDAFIPFFNSILDKYKIDVVIPTHDDVVLFLAKNEGVLRSKIAVPGLKQSIICRSKRATYQLFSGERFCPTVFESINSIDKFPVFAKPDIGQGGKGAVIINESTDSLLSMAFETDFVISEYLPGEELTVDCFTDRYNKLRFAGPRKRNRVFGGISVNSSTVPLSEEIKSIAAKIGEKIEMRGLWYFQVKKDISGNYKLLEISVRTAGTMNLYRGLGVNFPLLTVYDRMDLDIEIMTNDHYLEVDRSLFNKYKSDLEFDTIYIDFDDTITRKGKVNPFVMLFLYNAKNDNKNIRLITKHEFDLDTTLDSLSIHKGLFDEIIHLRPHQDKYEKISGATKAIFIDNAFRERSLVKKNLNLPVFDVDAINVLINWKE